MSQRVTIALPDDLHEKLQPFKSEINVSAICQEAIRRAVRIEEAKMNALSDREQTILRLKSEKENIVIEWQEQGRLDSFNYAQRMSYSQFKTAREIYDLWQPAEFPDWWIANQLKDSDQFGLLLERMEGTSRLDEDRVPESFRGEYLEGWLEGVVEFWNEISEEVEA